jgi:pimeloyl-ACP methyl ester carboxylesterase
LKASPLKIKAADPLTGAREPMKLSHDSVLGMVRTPLYAAHVVPLLPHVLQEAQTGNVDPLLVLGASMGSAMEDKFSFGMHLSVLCAEDVPRLDAPAQQAAVVAAQATRFGVMFIDAYRGMCAEWPAGTPEAAFFAPLRSDIPVLLLSGGADPVTPPRHAQSVLEGLSRGKHFVAENVGHGVSSAGCGPELVDKFIRAGHADALDGACLQQIPRPPFLLPIKPGKRAPALPAKASP